MELIISPAANPDRSSARIGAHFDTTGPQTAHEYAYSILREEIIKGRLVVGTRLLQADIASNLGVSTTPVREALRELAAEGLVTFDAHRGAVVRELSARELQEIYIIRDTLEALAAEHINVTPELLKKLRDLDSQMKAATNVDIWIELNRVFHQEIYSSTKLDRLSALIAELHDISIRYTGTTFALDPNVRRAANSGHDRILLALESGDRGSILSAVRAHLTMTPTTLIDRLSEE